MKTLFVTLSIFLSFVCVGCSNSSLATKDDVTVASNVQLATLHFEIDSLRTVLYVEIDSLRRVIEDANLAQQKDALILRTAILDIRAQLPVSAAASGSANNDNLQTPSALYPLSGDNADNTPIASPHGHTTTAQAADSSGEAVVGYTATGLALHEGPRGGIYHYSKSGRKVYQRH